MCLLETTFREPWAIVTELMPSFGDTLDRPNEARVVFEAHAVTVPRNAKAV